MGLDKRTNFAYQILKSKLPEEVKDSLAGYSTLDSVTKAYFKAILDSDYNVSRDRLAEIVGVDRKTIYKYSKNGLPEQGIKIPGDVKAIPTLEDVETYHILHVLEDSGWNKKRAAEVLRIERKTIRRKIRKYVTQHYPQTEPALEPVSIAAFVTPVNQG